MSNITLVYIAIISTPKFCFIVYILIIVNIIYNIVVISILKGIKYVNTELPFIEIISKNLYISNAYYDFRFNVVRVLTSFNPSYNYTIKITDESMRAINYSLKVYDKCMKSERYFPLKYGNILIKKVYFYNDLYISNGNRKHKIIVNYYNKIYAKKRTTWCITSLRNKYDALIQLNETINLSLKYKIDRIILYYSDITDRIMKTIKKYELIGFVESYYFAENSKSCDMKICGKILQLNDCFYKSLYNSDYILNADIDELLVPKIHSNYKSLLKWSELKYPFSNMLIFYTKLCIKSSYIFKENRKTPKDYMNLPKVLDVSIYDIKNCCTVEVVKKACSKYIIKPTMIEALWLHDIWEGEYNYTILPINIAYTRHTRHYSNGFKKICNNFSNDVLYKTK